MAYNPPLTAVLDEEPVTEADPGKPRPAPAGPSVLGATTVLRGELHLAEDLIIEGRFVGSITQGDQRLSIGEQAHVTATIRTGSAIIAGTVEGDVRGAHTVIVRKTATLSGALTAERLRLDFGADLEDVVLSGKVERIARR